MERLKLERREPAEIPRPKEWAVYEGAEIRTDGEGDGKSIVGHAAVFDKPAHLFPGYTEVVRAGAFTKTLKEGDSRALWNHDTNQVLGRASAGTLELHEDKKGLAIHIDPVQQDLYHAFDVSVGLPGFFPDRIESWHDVGV